MSDTVTITVNESTEEVEIAVREDAATLPVTDAGGYFDSDYVEDVLQEIGAELGTITGDYLEEANNLDDLESAATARTNLGVDAAGTDNSVDVTLNASATAAGISIAGQELAYRAATNVQTGYATAAHITAIEANTTHRGLTNNPHSVTPAQLNLVIGADVQAWNTQLDNFAGSNITVSGDDLANVGALEMDGDLTFSGAVHPIINPGSDVDAVGLQWTVAGTPQIKWDESETAIALNTGLLITTNSALKPLLKSTLTTTDVISANFFANTLEVIHNPSSPQGTYATHGLRIITKHGGSNNRTGGRPIRGLQVEAGTSSGSGTLNSASAISSVVQATGGDITDGYACYIIDSTGTITNNYGLYIELMNNGTTKNYAVYTKGGDVLFNADGDADTDFIVESDTYDALFIDASENSIDIMHHASGKIGFYGATPTVLQTSVGTDAASIHAALVTLGLITS